MATLRFEHKQSDFLLTQAIYNNNQKISKYFEASYLREE